MSTHARFLPTLLVLGAALLQGRPATAQLFQWTPEQLIKYTSKNPYDRFPDGRPKVPDEMLERLKVLVAEEVQAVLPGRGFPNQFEPREGWKVLQPNQKMVGRVLTIQFMPARGDIIDVDEADAKAKGTTAARNQTAIDMLQPGDVIVADVFGAEWNFVGNKLAHYIQTTTKNGMIVDGGVYWLDRIAETGMQAYFKNSLPAQGMRVMVTGRRWSCPGTSSSPTAKACGSFRRRPSRTWSSPESSPRRATTGASSCSAPASTRRSRFTVGSRRSCRRCATTTSFRRPDAGRPPRSRSAASGECPHDSSSCAMARPR